MFSKLKNRRIVLICVTFALSFVNISVAQNDGSGEAVIDDNFTTLKDSLYQISYPENWQIDQSGSRGTAFIIYMPSPGEVAGFKDNINLMVQDLTGYDLDLQGFTDLSLKQLEQMIKGVEVVSNDRKNDGNHDYQRLVFSSFQAGFDLKFEQRYWVIGKKAYVLTVTYLQKNASAQEPIIEKVFDTFKPLAAE
ncbi:hypothetical protein ACJD0Z_03275 [Flavobacteriaceae bacterium M23B6Z8]